MQASLDYLRTKVYAKFGGKQSALCGIRKDRIFAIFQYLRFGESIIPLFLSWCYDNGINAQLLVNDLQSFSWCESPKVTGTFSFLERKSKHAKKSNSFGEQILVPSAKLPMLITSLTFRWGFILPMSSTTCSTICCVALYMWSNVSALN